MSVLEMREVAALLRNGTLALEMSAEGGSRTVRIPPWRRRPATRAGPVS